MNISMAEQIGEIAMPVPDPIEGCVAIPCRHCGQTLQLSIVHPLPNAGLQCLDCGESVPLYVSGLVEDMRSASRILAYYRRRMVGE